MNNISKFYDREQPVDQRVDIAPDSKYVLTAIGIDPAILKSVQPIWKRTHYRAVINWLTKYKPQSNCSNLEKVKGFLEAFYHLCELEAWEQASQLLLIHFNTPTREQLHQQLNTWGYYPQQANLYSKILHKLNSNLDTVFFVVWAMLLMRWLIMPRRLSITSIV